MTSDDQGTPISPSGSNKIFTMIPDPTEPLKTIVTADLQPGSVDLKNQVFTIYLRAIPKTPANGVQIAVYIKLILNIKVNCLTTFTSERI